MLMYYTYIYIYINFNSYIHIYIYMHTTNVTNNNIIIITQHIVCTYEYDDTRFSKFLKNDSSTKSAPLQCRREDLQPSTGSSGSRSGYRRFRALVFLGVAPCCAVRFGFMTNVFLGSCPFSRRNRENQRKSCAGMPIAVSECWLQRGGPWHSSPEHGHVAQLTRCLSRSEKHSS